MGFLLMSAVIAPYLDALPHDISVAGHFSTIQDELSPYWDNGFGVFVALNLTCNSDHGIGIDDEAI